LPKLKRTLISRRKLPNQTPIETKRNILPRESPELKEKKELLKNSKLPLKTND
jgi:hypothetical protein